MPNQTITARALKKYTVSNVLLSFQKINKKLKSRLNIEEEVVIVYESAYSNPIKEVTYPEFDEENFKTANRVFRVYNVGKDYIEEIRMVITLAGSSDKTPMVKLFKKQPLKAKKVLFISQTAINEQDAQNIVERLFGKEQRLKTQLIKRIKASYVITDPLVLRDKVAFRYNNGTAEFIHPLPPTHKGLRNLESYSYENVSKDDLKAILILHSLESDSVKMPFSDIKSEKLFKLGKVEVNEQPIYKSILLIEALFRLFTLEGQLIEPLNVDSNHFFDLPYNEDDEEVIF